MHRSLELKFSVNVNSPLLTGDHIKGVGGVPIKVILVDSHTKEEVKSGPEASGRVKVVVLEGEVDGVRGEDGRNELENILVGHMEGKKSRVGIVCLNLIEGTALLPLVSFTRNSKWMKISTFRLAARFMDNFNGVRVKEAQTEPFVLKDRRTASYKKHSFPSLHDDAWRLNKIGRKGPLARSLSQAKIKTVEDFIVCLFLHRQCLKEIFDGAKSAKSFEPAVKHAQTCPAKLMYRSNCEQKTEVVFNVSGEVLGLFRDGQFVSRNTLSETQKEVASKMITSAFRNWADVTPFDEEQFVAHCSPHLPSNPSSPNPACHQLAKTETVTPCINMPASTHDKSILFDGVDLHINESYLFGNVLSDGHHLSPEFLTEPLRTKYDAIYHQFHSELVCASHQREPESVLGLVGTQAARKSKSYKRWRMLYWVVIITVGSSTKMKNSYDIRPQKKLRLS